MSNQFYTLSNGYKFPKVCLGTSKTSGDELKASVKSAIKLGYRGLDTAQFYENEKEIGEAVRETGSDIMIMTKLANSKHGYDNALFAFEESEKLLGRVDVFLIHFPGLSDTYFETWRAFEKLYKDGRVKAIGVSNFLPRHLEELKKRFEIVPMVNEIEVHPFFYQAESIAYCQKNNIQVAAWRPINECFKDPVITEIAQKYGKTNAQITLRFLVEKGICPLPKSVHEERLAQNIDIFDFSLSEDDVKRIEGLNCGRRTGPDPEKDFDLDPISVVVARLKAQREAMNNR